MVSPSSSMIYFTLLTSTYFGLKYFMVEQHGTASKSLGIVMTIVYLAIMIMIQFSANYTNAKEKCGGTPQLVPAINYTVIPNLIIFGSLLMAMMFFPGWKAPFSNTIGYCIIRLLNVKTVFTNMLVEDSNNKLLKMVYRDPSMMINEITPENFQIFLSKMSGSKHSILNSNYKQFVPQLYNLVVIKDKIAEFIWYILTGALVISNSYSYIMTIKCKRSVSELEGKLNKAMEKDKKPKKKKEKWKLGY